MEEPGFTGQKWMAIAEMVRKRQENS